MFFPSLWLDASTGVNKFSYNYISQIVLSGDPSVTGTYNASSIPTYNFEDQRLNDYSLGDINYNNYNDDYAYRIITENLDGNDIGYQSYNGINWSAFNSYTSQLIITGFTGAYTNANGTYDLANATSSDPAYSNGIYQLFANELQLIAENYLTVATKNNDGSFTPINYINKVTISEAGIGSEYVNGVYTRTSPGVGFTAGFTGPTSLSWDSEAQAWYLGNEEYIAYGLNNLTTWELFNNGEEPAPVGVAETVLLAIGDGRISSTISSPNGSITGTITTSNIATDYVASWNDQSANGRNVSQYDSAVPSTITIADKKFINFTANAPLAGTTFFNSNYIGTIFVVANFDSSSAGSTSPLFSDYDGFKLGRGIDSTNAFYLQNQTSDYSDTITTISNINVNNNTSYIIGTTFSGTSASLYLNGADAGTGFIGDLGTPPNSNFLIGPINEPSNIAEVIAYNRVLNTSERQEVESYLANKYSITPTPPGIPYASTASITSDYLAFTLTKENDNGDGNLLYSFDESQTTPPRPANYYGYSVWDFDTGTGSRAILFFNTSATTYVSNQPNVAPNVTLSPNTWYLIKFSAGNYDEGSIPPIPDEFSVNTSSSQSADYIPTTGWSPSITITAA
jgi:hypothetical protein